MEHDLFRKPASTFRDHALDRTRYDHRLPPAGQRIPKRVRRTSARNALAGTAFRIR
jgi:hypothetical protein